MRIFLKSEIKFVLKSVELHRPDYTKSTKKKDLLFHYFMGILFLSSVLQFILREAFIFLQNFLRLKVSITAYMLFFF